jgi:septation ring formation regulator EzrA
MYDEHISMLETNKRQCDERLQDANRALALADCHLKQEIEKIKNNLEQDYNRMYEHDQIKHRNELEQLRQQLTDEFDKQKSNWSTSAQDIDEMKKMYRTEIDRLYRKIFNRTNLS